MRLFILSVLLLFACAHYSNRDIRISGPYKSKLAAAADLVPLRYTRAIAETPVCQTFATVGGLTIVGVCDIMRPVRDLARLLSHEDCHHQQWAEDRPTNEAECT